MNSYLYALHMTENEIKTSRKWRDAIIARSGKCRKKHSTFASFASHIFSVSELFQFYSHVPRTKLFEKSAKRGKLEQLGDHRCAERLEKHSRPLD